MARAAAHRYAMRITRKIQRQVRLLNYSPASFSAVCAQTCPNISPPATSATGPLLLLETAACLNLMNCREDTREGYETRAGSTSRKAGITCERAHHVFSPGLYSPCVGQNVNRHLCRLS